MNINISNKSMFIIIRGVNVILMSNLSMQEGITGNRKEAHGSMELWATRPTDPDGPYQ